jgi:ABC-type antimicrobial peptide transport system permease subunit
VISESAAAAMWPGLDPIGRQLRYRQFPAITVVGVSADPVTSIQTSEWERPSNFVYFPLAQHHQGQVQIVLRSQAPLAQIEPLRRAVASVNDQVALIDPTTIEEGLLRWSSAMRATVALVTALGAVSLAIAMLGVYGVISFFVSTRTREIGIRSALGATPGRVLKMVVDQAIHIVLVGLLSGVLVATLGTRVVLATIPRLMPAGITPWVVVPILILVSGVLAGYLPARRAARIDPNVALREL